MTRHEAARPLALLDSTPRPVRVPRPSGGRGAGKGRQGRFERSSAPG